MKKKLIAGADFFRKWLKGLVLAGLVVAANPALVLAMGSGPQGGEGKGGAGAGLGALPMLLIIFAIFYFLLIRPQQKQVRQHQDLIKGLKRGDEVITSGGIHGRIVEIEGAVVVLEVADRVKIRVVKDQVNSKRGQEVKATPEKKEAKGKAEKEKKG